MGTHGLHAVLRFGLGPRPDQPLPRDARGWLLAQVRPPEPLPGPGLDALMAAERTRPQDGVRDPRTMLVRQERMAWASRMLLAEASFVERWDGFWTNHLAVSRRAGGVAAIAAAHHARTAIRPHLFGRFEAMLLASHAHPAMLAYLDQGNSMGPASPAGQQRGGRPAAENLARETLELHTLSPAAGYRQADVEALALLLSGWSFGRGAAAGEAEGFLFRPASHQPGPKTLMGREFAEGEAGGRAALAFLASHPATFRHLAGKIARHFIADAPPPAAAAAIEAALAGSGGDLGAAARALVAQEAAWRPLAKVATAQDYAIGVLRAMGLGAEAAGALLVALDRLGQPLLSPPAPTGWRDSAEDWATADQAARRLEWAAELAGMMSVAAPLDPEALADRARGPLLPPAQRAAVAAHPALREAYLLVMAAPGMHRR